MPFLDIIFQSGEFYGSDDSFFSDLFINIAGALIGTGTALYVFYLTAKHERKKQLISESKLVEQKLSYFSSMVKTVVGLSNQQGIYLEEFTETLKNDLMVLPKITILPYNNLKRFSEIQNYEDYYHAYIAKFGYSEESIREYRSIYSKVDFMYEMILQFKESLMKSMEFDYEKKDNYRKIVDDALTRTAFLVNEARNKGEIDEFAAFLNQVLIAYHTQPDIDYADLRRVQRDFVDIVKIGCVQRFRHIPAAIELADALKRATHIFSHIEFSNKGILNDFVGQTQRFKAASDELREASIRLTR